MDVTEDNVVIIDDNDSNDLALESFRNSNRFLLEKSIQEAREKYQDREDNLSHMASLTPDIPISHSNGAVMKWRWNGYIFKGNTLLPHGVKTFFMRTGFSVHEYVAVSPGNKLGHIREVVKSRERIEHTFFGKIVIDGEYVGGSSSGYVETEKFISFPLDLNLPDDYERNLYRNVEGGIEIGEKVIHFAGVPWSVEATEGEYYSNVVLRNLHTSELRRFILEGYTKHSKFFMLQGEVYFTRTISGKVYHEIVHCPSNTVVRTKDWKIDSITTCKDYVVIQVSDYIHSINVVYPY